MLDNWSITILQFCYTAHTWLFIDMATTIKVVGLSRTSTFCCLSLWIKLLFFPTLLPVLWVEWLWQTCLSWAPLLSIVHHKSPLHSWPLLWLSPSHLTALSLPARRNYLHHNIGLGKYDMNHAWLAMCALIEGGSVRNFWVYWLSFSFSPSPEYWS